MILFVVFYTQACRWSRCLGCNLPARMSRHHVGFRHLMSDEEGVRDIADAVAYLHHRSQQYGCHISVHLNPTYVAFGTLLERRFRLGEYSPPRLRDVARAALHAEGTSLSVFLGLSDEGLACEGGSFVRPGDEAIIARLEAFNRTQDYGLLRAVAAMPKA